MTEQDSSKPTEEAIAEDGCYVCEPGDSVSSTAGRDLIAAGVIIVFSIFVMILAVRLQNPDTVSTHPGLLPFLIGLTLMAMAIGLGVRSIRLGGLQAMLQAREGSMRAFFTDAENRRMLLLIGIIIAYVVLTDRVAFEWQLPIGFFFSGYELFSILTLTLILRIFWQATLVRCLLVSGGWIIALASAFRYAFHILMPGLG